MALTLNPDMYVTESELTDEGLLSSSPTAAEEARVEMLAETASRYIDKVTRRWFWDRAFVEDDELYIDGGGSRHLHVPGAPLISVEKVETQADYDSSWEEVAASAYRAYLHDPRTNRHGDNPKLMAVALIGGSVPPSVVTRSRPRWPKGFQNIRLQAHLGYLDDEGNTPLPIRRACMRLMMLEFETIDDDGAAEVRAVRAGSFQSKSTHNRSLTLGDLMASGAYTGDALIDRTLQQYRLPIL